MLFTPNTNFSIISFNVVILAFLKVTFALELTKVAAQSFHFIVHLNGG